MPRISRLLLISALSSLFALSAFSALAAEQPGAAQNTPPPAQNAPAAKADEKRGTVIGVEHEGKDTLGARLAFQLKEAFNTSSRYSLTDDNAQPRFKLVLVTQTEFESRPGLGSIYAVIWTYSNGGDVLGYYLLTETGIITPDDIPGLVTKLAERTDGIVARYGFLKKD